MMNGQIISKTYEFSSTTPLRYVDHENDPYVGERAYAYVVCVCGQMEIDLTTFRRI